MRRTLEPRILNGLLLLLYMGAIAAANLLTPDKPISESENRVLEQRPRLSGHALLTGRFMSDYERYATDQFAFRDAWAGLKTDAERALGKKESNGVFLGKDGYLLERYTSPSEAELSARIRALRMWDQAAPRLNKVVMLAPTAASLMADKLPAFAPVDDERADLERIRRQLPRDMRFVDVYAALDAKREQSLYYKTDHHWTTQGAYYAYRALCEQLELVPLDEAAYDIRQATDEFYGSLYSKSGFRRLRPDRIDLYWPKKSGKLQVTYVDEGRMTDSLYEPDRLDDKDKYAVFLNGNHAWVRIAGDGPAGKNLLVVKDSYANSLLPFLTSHYGEIDVVDLRYFDQSLLELTENRNFQDMLILYNIRTFFEDPSILNLAEEST
ncbi:DHHW family protein [Cohnella cellulosilytica]|uniref:DHHW family protein n=1 Tax=Cohnella cellulosilytica TaxID=986710 RepID=A0ABW2FKW2_9BACL